jgi:F-type H+-transporting ATPase subunit gamma
MASIKTIRKRISSVKNTRQITRAMKLVAAAKLRRAQDAITMARPFAQKLRDVMTRLALYIEGTPHALLEVREEKKVRVVVVTSDRGLCGGFNSNVVRRTLVTLRELRSRGCEVQVDFVGRKGRDALKTKIPEGVTLGQVFENVFNRVVNFTAASKIAEPLAASYEQHQFDAIYFIYNEFKSAISQSVVAEKLLPLEKDPAAPALEGMNPYSDYLYEPGKMEILAEVTPKYFATQVYRALLESVASEHGARMTAMDSATKNASEMIRKLTLTHNRIRQAAITKELMEIVSGAEAQKA